MLPHGFEARGIGPAAMGGRVSSIAFDSKRPSRYYVGFGMGGVMKTSDNGITFKPIFAHEKVAAIGDVAVSPSDPTEIWVGTGEANDRNSGSWGDGVYLSTDTGTTWTNVGLKDSKSIARIAVHPTDPKTAYAAVIGDLWMPNTERGLYKTTDAGTTWHKVLGAQPPYDDPVRGEQAMVAPIRPDPNVGVRDSVCEAPAALVVHVRLCRDRWQGPGRDLQEHGWRCDVAQAYGWTAGGDGPRRTLTRHARAARPLCRRAKRCGRQDGQVSTTRLSKAGGVFRSGDGGEHWTRVSKLLDPRPFLLPVRSASTRSDSSPHLPARLRASSRPTTAA